MKKTLFMLALVASMNAHAQKIHRSGWSVQPKVRSSSLVLSGVTNLIEDALLEGAGAKEMDDDDYAEFWIRNSWFIPEITTSFPIYSVRSDDGAKLVNPFVWRELLWWGDYSHTFRFSAGYELGWKSLVSPFGAFVGVNWEYSQIVLKNCAESGKHHSQAIVPSVGIRFRLWGGSFEREWKPALEIGGAYVCNFKYHGPGGYKLGCLNNGFRGKAALGVEFPNTHDAFLIEYSHNFFNYFNKDYEVDGTRPFEGYKNTFGEIALRYSHSF